MNNNNNQHQQQGNHHQQYSVPPFQNPHQMLYSLPQYHQSTNQHSPTQHQQPQFYDTIQPSNYIMMQNVSPPTYTNQQQQQFFNYQQQQQHQHQLQQQYHQQQLLQQHHHQQQQSQVQKKPTSPKVKKPIKSPVDGSKHVIHGNFPERIQEILPAPPLSRASIRPDITISTTAKRAKRKSKFSQEQDDMIVNLKRKGKSWVEIAEIAGVDSYLAARNRYQVIVGQQGNNNSSAWDNKDKVFLQQLLDAGEFEKWKFISNELNKSTNKNFTDYECREMIRELFWLNPVSFGVSEETIKECQKEKKLTEKTIEQREQQKRKRLSIIEGTYQQNQSQPHCFTSTIL
ncbi:unnamed protein product [Candida verbasci]|uniref:Adherence factor n=1 Tax=Candida verbasci TaxID=1227364 RepID=A0A9W4XLH4_9ASCO|nr:unnamed protein product [Candida verbasci]